MIKDMESMARHLREDIEYPATKQQLVEACNRMSDISDNDREWFRKNLPSGTFQSADEVIGALESGQQKKGGKSKSR